MRPATTTGRNWRPTASGMKRKKAHGRFHHRPDRQALARFCVSDRGHGCADARNICPLHRKLARIARRLVHHAGEYDETCRATELAGSFRLPHGRSVDQAVLGHRDGSAFRPATYPVAVQVEWQALRDLHAMSAAAHWHAFRLLAT
jgi:hypothetical protein